MGKRTTNQPTLEQISCDGSASPSTENIDKCTWLLEDSSEYAKYIFENHSRDQHISGFDDRGGQTDYNMEAGGGDGIR